jgi:transcriptional regulator with XRE-family HTH domain
VTEYNNIRGSEINNRLNGLASNGVRHGKLADYSTLNNPVEPVSTSRAASTVNSYTPSWELPRPKKRGRKPGSGLANKAARKDTDMSSNNRFAGSEDQPEIRKRKRETEVLVGEQIRHLRIESNLSQEELGRASHMSTSYISRLETNEVNPTVDALNRIVRVFGLTIDGLLNLDTNSPGIMANEDLDPQIRVLLFKLKGKKVSERTKRIMQVVIEEELKETHHHPI